MKIGSRVRINDDVDMTHCVYKKGHEFTIVDEGERGFDLKDEDGNMIYETRLMHHKLELI